MQIVAWNDSLKTDIDVVDQQHRGLVELVNATAGKLADTPELSADEVRLLLGYLTDYAQVHFSTEEALMALCGLEARQTDHHHESHARFLAQVSDMAEALGEDGVLDAQRLLMFLGDWLIDHIQGEDQTIARSLRAALAAASPAGEPATAGSADPLGGWEARARALVAPAGEGEPAFADVVARHSASLLASEAGVLDMCAHGEVPALIVSLDAALMPAEILHANAAAAEFLGVAPAVLGTRRLADVLASNEAARFPILVSEVLMAGRFEGPMRCRGRDGADLAVRARVIHLALHGQMVLLVLLRPVADAAPAAAEPAERLREDSSVLSRHPLFQVLDAHERDSLEAASRLMRLPKGKVVYHRDDAPQGIYLVISGQVKLAVSNARGGEKVMEIVSPLQVFGEIDALTGRPHAMFAQSLTGTVLLLVPQAPLEALMTRSLPFARAVALHIGQRYHAQAADLEAYALQTGLERVVSHLLQHARTNGHGVLEAVLPAQKQVIASYLNLTPPTLSRTFQQLTEAGLIEMSGRYVRIPNKRRLLNFCPD
ncbi:bacteriohemerythrin [Denitromonas sp.]|uniref:bacteriohemerythrin n=1 Tax=Denitromonas sp. TaxID=2734609 RepID=UPI002AFE0547|nr:bacteriohemerythrin [Denitromonas sp.]